MIPLLDKELANWCYQHETVLDLCEELHTIKGKNMKISEYTLLQSAFEAAFPFMLNRISEVYDEDLSHDPLLSDEAEDRCWNEFMVAVEQIGIELEDVRAPLKVRDEIYK
jgi:hypothetical protein